MKKITRSQLVKAIESRKGAEAIRLFAETDARLLKTDNPHPDARKQTIVSALLGTRYAENINKLLPAGESFQVSPRKWGVSRPSGKIVDHKGKVYLTVRTTGRARRVNKATVSFVSGEGQPLAFDAVRAFLPARGGSAKQGDLGIDRENQVEQRAIAIENIRAVKMRGEFFQVVPD